MARTGTPIIAFISYTHDSDSHKKNVLTLAQKLRDDGIETKIDQFINGHPPEGWPTWMERQIKKADYVLSVWTENHRRRHDGEEKPGRGLGATWEAALSRQALYQAQGKNEKFIPVLLDGGSSEHIPDVFKQYTYYHLMADYKKLYRHLTAQPATPPRPLGPIKKLPPNP